MNPIAEASLDANRSWRPWFRVMVAQRAEHAERTRQYWAERQLYEALEEKQRKGGSWEWVEAPA